MSLARLQLGPFPPPFVCNHVTGEIEAPTRVGVMGSLPAVKWIPAVSSDCEALAWWVGGCQAAGLVPRPACEQFVIVEPLKSLGKHLHLL